ncbi:piggyBac transposable element-derived protein 4-like [Pseudomyrmex gracilis]|uniref:piggyBac transposable element-derived protein 4-like n=1 Tax=Pseudomyrmex gracilis TaxID=219809 RepID=UPI0009957844|nr:piggyBac transposable element-derived protein 4-like [Pseudomyrmex gracilis]
MGHVIKGQLKDYWSQDPLLYTPIYGESLSRNRYLQILRYLHFSNNEEVSNHPLKKIKPVIDHLKEKFADCETGFLLDFIVYTGSDTDYEKFDLGVSGDIVAHFMQPYCNEERVLYTDNWYTSPQLSDYLHDRNTGLCGTVKKNRKGMPTLSSKLDRGETEVAHRFLDGNQMDG